MARKIRFPVTVACSGDSLWGRTKGVKIKIVDIEIDERARLVYVHHDKPWWVCTDTGFESAVSKIVGRLVSSCETDMQEENMTVMEW